MKNLFFILLILIAQAVHAEQFLRAHDGDSFYVDGIKKEIRLRYVDAPELKAFKWQDQPYGAEAKAALYKLCDGQNVVLTKQVPDTRTKRIMANASCQGQDVATYLIENGHAWAYHLKTPKRYYLMQDKAKANNLGLWAQPDPIDPYFWRKGITR